MKAVLTAMSAVCLLLACGSQPAATPTASEVPPKVESLVQPAYPEEARKAGVEGTTIVDVTVSADGAVLGCSLATSSGNDLLDAAAIGAAQNSKFAPGTKDGKPVVMKVKVPFRFKLEDSHSEGHSDAQGVKVWAIRFMPALPAMEV
jgi:periplasmic protein TonB